MEGIILQRKVAFKPGKRSMTPTLKTTGCSFDKSVVDLLSSTQPMDDMECDNKDYRLPLEDNESPTKKEDDDNPFPNSIDPCVLQELKDDIAEHQRMEWEANGSLATALQGVSPLQHANLSLLF